MTDELDIAIIGLAGRWPGASTPDEFWRNLAAGVESITRFTDAELLQAGVSRARLADSHYVKASPVLDQPGHFDAAFFGYSPAEARTMDPQHRLLLELAHEAMEHAACDSTRCDGRIGVFAGSAMNTYFMASGLRHRFAAEYIPTLICSDKDFLSTRISYKLNLTGPSLTVQTACSTSLVAIHLARQSLLSGETDIALAGAVSVRVPHRVGYVSNSEGILSADGHVRAFDAAANGTVFGSGGGVLVLKRLADAVSSGDTIHAVIKGSAVNNDGSNKVAYTAPSVTSQSDVVTEAIADAGVAADLITYVEGHGSGTPLGDGIEIRALTRAFRAATGRSGYCALGSVKTNIGHLDAAAGMAGVIKTVLALEHGQLPPTLHYNGPNPQTDLSTTPFYVNTSLIKWPGDEPRRAAVISTGMGGTNACVIVEQAPEPVGTVESSAPQLLVLSAKTETAVEQAAAQLREFLTSHPSANLADVAHTLQDGRRVFQSRRALVAVDKDDAIAALSDGARLSRGHADSHTRRPVIFLLPGVGDHYVGMAHGLYESWTTFRAEIDRCADILEPHLGVDIRDILYPKSDRWRPTERGGIDFKKMLGRRADAPVDPEVARLNAVQFTQPALFSIEYAVARLWQSWGIAPDALVAHSMGEYVAACLAGVVSLDDALRLIARRATLVSSLPEGAMLAVTLSEAELRPFLSSDISIALINGPRLCIVAGTPAAVSELERQLAAAGIVTRRVQNSHAFHSHMLDPIVGQLEAEFASVTLKAPEIPYISSVTGTWIRSADATDPRYWAQHASRTVRFSDALQTLWTHEHPVLVEVGPGRTLGVLAMQHPDGTSKESVSVASVRHEYDRGSDASFILQSVGKLWCAGLDVHRAHARAGESHRKIPLPTYPFERQEYWLRPERDASPLVNDRNVSPSTIDDWFYAPSWERANGPAAHPEFGSTNATWLVIADRYHGGASVKAELDRHGIDVTFVRFGKEFRRTRDGSLEINPTRAEDYRRLLEPFQAASTSCINIVHLGALTRTEPPLCHDALNQDYSLSSLLCLAQAIGDLGISVPVAIGVVSNQVYEVTGEEALRPGMATISGACGVIPKELPNVRCFNVDLADGGDIDRQPRELLQTILSEFSTATRSSVVAYRGRFRWERRFQHVSPTTRLATPLTKTLTNAPTLRQRGVYLITGGTGGIGLVIARYLATACQARLVLTKRTALPARPLWRQVTASAATPASLRATLTALLEIEEAGAIVEVLVADVANRAEMQQVHDAVISRHGAIHGVIHAAGIVSDGLIRVKTQDQVDSVLRPKLYGTAVLFELFKDRRLDFLVLFSSLTSVLTPYAVAEYSSANAFLDAFGAFANRTAPFRTVTINWPGWKSVGQLANLKIARGFESVKETLLQKAILPEEGLEAFKRILHSDLAHVLVSPDDLCAFQEESQAAVDPALQLAKQPVAGIQGRKDGKVSSYRSKEPRLPRTPTELALDEVWREVLGTDDSDIDASFFDLGGHS
ncbi:MAG TPA: SDR family NAD(P)-dependent oxidoreductase, partial [Vicinamibacterales bacterium]